MHNPYVRAKDLVAAIICSLVLVSTAFGQEFELNIDVSDGEASTTLTLGIDPDGTAGEEDLDVLAPPRPPEGSFDARFVSDVEFFTDIRDNSQTEKVFVLDYQASSGAGPVVLSWNNSNLASIGTFHIVDNVTGNLVGPIDMTETSQLDVSNYDDLDNTEGSIRILVTPVSSNEPPELSDDELTVEEDQSGMVDVLANDSDPEGDPLSLSIASEPSQGTAAVDDGGTPEDPSDDQIRYTPEEAYTGSDSFTYRAADGQGNTATATVSVTITPVNDPPVATDDTGITTDEDTPVTIDVLANDTDADGDELEITGVVTGPEDGTAQVDDGGTPGDLSDDQITYTPAAGFSGADSFEYEITDGQGGTSTAAVAVEINVTESCSSALKLTDFDSDQGDVADPTDDTGEFVEITNTGNDTAGLGACALVFYDGATSKSYFAMDLSGSLEAGASHVVGNPDVENADQTFSENTMQNGPDGLALYKDEAASFPDGTDVTTENLLSGIVYINDRNIFGAGKRAGTFADQLEQVAQSSGAASEEQANLPRDFALDQNYPNPFNPSTTIRFGVPERTHVRLTVYDVAGRQVRELTSREMEAGWHELRWNGRNGAGQQVSSGLYLYRIEAGSYRETRQMLFMK
jgi:hypothetical protein